MSLQDVVVGYVTELNTTVVQPRLTEWWNRIEPHYETAKRVLVFGIIAFNIACISLIISAFLFGTIYFYNMPTIYHTFPLHFQYDRLCMQQHKVFETRGKDLWQQTYKQRCFPVSTILMASPKAPMLLQEAQQYSIVVRMELPETPSNLEMGMFMVKMDVNGYTPGGPSRPFIKKSKWTDTNYGTDTTPNVTYSSSRSVSLQYKSPIIHYMYKVFFWPLLMFGFQHESQKLDVVLYENLMLKQANLNWNASVYIEHPSIDIYSAHLDITAQFTGLQHLLYRWPILSFLLGTTVFFLPVLFTVIVLFYFCIWRPLCGPRTPSPERIFSRQRRHRQRTLSDRQVPSPDNNGGASNTDEENDHHDAAPIEVVGGSNDDEAVEAIPHSRRSSSSSIEMLFQPALLTESQSTSSYVIPTINSSEESSHQSHQHDVKDNEATEEIGEDENQLRRRVLEPDT
ncbi:unnamed protein product [Clavelina lepadiformis]|uniref:Seipin n=1 Tax=Clavelina lepadiformis TaxID=159417 RepID=A0ABP0GLF5_CLALP